MSKVTVNIKEVQQVELIPSLVRINTPHILANKKTGRKYVAIRLGNNSFVFFGDDGEDISYTSERQESVEWVDANYIVCVGVKATVTLEVD